MPKSLVRIVIVAGLVVPAAGCGPDDDAARFEHLRARVEAGADDGIDVRPCPTVSDAQLVDLVGVDGLRHLLLDGSKVSSAGMASVGRVHGLETLSLSGTGVTDAGLDQLSGLRRLKRLVLDKLPVTDDGMSAVGKLRSLRLLSLWRTRVTDRGLPALAGMDELVVLSLDETGVTGAGVADLVGRLPRLKYLSVWGTVVGPVDVRAVTDRRPDIRVNW